MMRKSHMRKHKMSKRNLYAAVIVTAILTTVVVLSPGCKRAEEGGAYAQSIKITAEPVNGSGVLVIIEYYRDTELVNSIRLIDGDGDNIVDGKSGPKEKGHWPRGWAWFDDLYDDVIVGYSTIAVIDGKVKIQDGTTHEFRTGDYQAERVGSNAG